MKIEKAIGISDAKIQFVSLVDKAANKRRFLIAKADNGTAQFSTTGKIVKSDAASHYITGIVYEPLVEDAHGNYMTEDEIKKAAYWFAKNGDKVDLQHNFEAVDGVAVVENYIAPGDMTIAGQKIAKGTWLMTVEVDNDEVWDKVQKGEVTGFSMGGVGKYSEKDDDLTEMTEKRGVFKKLASFFGLDVVEKGSVKDTFNKRRTSDEFWTAVHALEDTLSCFSYSEGAPEFTTDDSVIREALQDFSEVLQAVLAETNIVKALSKNAPVEKAGKKLSGKNRGTLKTIYESLGKLLEENSENNKEESELSTTEIQALIDGAIKKALAPADKTDEETKKPEDKSGEKKPELTEETVKKMIDDAIQKTFAPTKLESTVEKAVTAEDVQAMVAEAVTKAVEPIMKARGLSSNLNGEEPIEKHDEPHYLAGIL